MGMTLFLNTVLNAVIRILGTSGFVIFCSIPAHAGNSKAFDKYDPPSDLILTLPNQWPASGKTGPLINQNAATHNNNESQTSALKSPQLIWTAI